MFQDPDQRAIAIARLDLGVLSAGSAIGPVLGGVMLEYFWWGSVFLLALPVMGAAARPRAARAARVPRPGRGPLDLASAAMSLVAILAVIFGLKHIAQDGFGPVPSSRSASGSSSARSWSAGS